MDKLYGGKPRVYANLLAYNCIGHGFFFTQICTFKSIIFISHSSTCKIEWIMVELKANCEVMADNTSFMQTFKQNRLPLAMSGATISMKTITCTQ